jgi:sodium/hydrogen antiporter
VSGTLIGRLVVYLRGRHKASVGLDEFLALGLIALAYGLAVLSHTYGFLSVLAAGVALRRVTEFPAGVSKLVARQSSLQASQANEAHATDVDFAGAYMIQEVQGFNEQLERIAEVAIVLVVSRTPTFTPAPSGSFCCCSSSCAPCRCGLDCSARRYRAISGS